MSATPGTRLPARSRTAILGFLSAYAALSIDIITPAIPLMGRDLAVPLDRMQWVVGALLIGFGLGQLLWGWLSDWLGRRPVLLVGLAGYLLASLGCALAPEGETILLLRGVQGMVAAAPAVLARAIIRDRLDGAAAARALSTVLAVFYLTPMLAPLVGVGLLAVTGWRGLFGFTAVMGAAGWLAAWAGLPESLDVAKRLRKSLLQTFGIGWQVVSTPGSRGALLVILGLAFCLYSYISLASVITVDSFSYTPGQFALLFTGLAAVQMAATLTSRALLTHAQPLALLQAGATTAIAACILLAVAAGTADLAGHLQRSAAVLVAAMALFMVGFGLAMANAQAIALSPFGHAAGMASAVIGACQSMLGGGFAGVMGTRYDGTPSVLVPAMACAALTLLLGLALVRSDTSKPPGDAGFDPSQGYG